MIDIHDLMINPRIKHEAYFEVMRDLGMGGLNSSNFDSFIREVKNLPPQSERRHAEAISMKFQLTSYSIEEFFDLQKELVKRSADLSKICLHSEAPEHCDINGDGKINIAADLVKKNSFLTQIAEDEHVISIAIGDPEYDGENLGIKVKSKFFGFCRKHKAIFDPIEKAPYISTPEQNFLFAYRAFILDAHQKFEASQFINLDEECENELRKNLVLFHRALSSRDYSCIETDVFAIMGYYPMFGSLSFQVDFDYEGLDIFNSHGGRIFVTLLPQHDKCLILFSYFKGDRHLSNLINQIINRQNIKSDISILLMTRFNNIYFNPSFFYSCIQQQKTDIEHAYFEANLGLNLDEKEGFTPKEHMQNPYGINFFRHYLLNNSSTFIN